jgi:hypothetical protein
MSLLTEIIDGAADDAVRLQTLLRKCLILAAKLKNERLRVWASSELNGYENKEELPPYRCLDVQSKGFLLGPFQSQINDQPLATGVMKPEHRDFATKAFLMDPIAAYETMAGDKSEGSFRSDWPGDLVAMYQSKFAKGWVLNRAWQELSLGNIVAIVDTVRTRLLQFTLEIQDEIGDETDDLAQAAPDKVERAVGTIIYGGYNVVAGLITGDVRIQTQQMVVEGDFISLSNALAATGVPQDKIKELERAVEQDRAAGAEKGFGERVRGWMSKAGSYTARAAGEAASHVSKEAITAAVLAYFGLGS